MRPTSQGHFGFVMVIYSVFGAFRYYSYQQINGDNIVSY